VAFDAIRETASWGMLCSFVGSRGASDISEATSEL
jgi:hypothetical protein